MRRTRVTDALHSTAAVAPILVKGWVRTRRDAKGFSFLEINDGSCLRNLQVIVDEACPAYAALQSVTTGAAIEAEGALVESPGKGQQWELRAAALRLLGRPIRRRIRCKKSATQTNIYAPSRTSGQAPTNTALCFASGPKAPLPCTSFSVSGVFTICTRPSSPARTAKEPARCSG